MAGIGEVEPQLHHEQNCGEPGVEGVNLEEQNIGAQLRRHKLQRQRCGDVVGRGDRWAGADVRSLEFGAFCVVLPWRVRSRSRATGGRLSLPGVSWRNRENPAVLQLKWWSVVFQGWN